MTTRSVAITVGALVLAGAVAGFAGAGLPDEPAPLQQFKAAIGEYITLHRQLEQQLPPFDVTTEAQQIFESSNAMAAAIQTARAGAHQGDIFGSHVAAYLRTRISEALTAHGFLPEEVISSTLEEADEAVALPAVNGRFPWGRGAIMWPCIIEALPQLPAELQYRIVGRDLVLVDTHADLVVDILRDAVR